MTADSIWTVVEIQFLPSSQFNKSGEPLDERRRLIKEEVACDIRHHAGGRLKMEAKFDILAINGLRATGHMPKLHAKYHIIKETLYSSIYFPHSLCLLPILQSSWKCSPHA